MRAKARSATLQGSLIRNRGPATKSVPAHVSNMPRNARPVELVHWEGGTRSGAGRSSSANHTRIGAGRVTLRTRTARADVKSTWEASGFTTKAGVTTLWKTTLGHRSSVLLLRSSKRSVLLLSQNMEGRVGAGCIATATTFCRMKPTAVESNGQRKTTLTAAPVDDETHSALTVAFSR